MKFFGVLIACWLSPNVAVILMAFVLAKVSQRSNMRRLADSLPVTMAYLDPNYRYQAVNLSYAQQCGLEVHEILGRKFHEVLPPDRTAQLTISLARAFQNEIVEFDEVWNERTYHVSCVPKAGRTGEVLGVSLLATDVTRCRQWEIDYKLADLKLRKAREKLSRNEERLNLALSSMSMFVWEWDPITDHVTRSLQARSILGLEDGPRSVFIELVHPDDRQKLSESLHGAHSSGEEFVCEFRLKRPVSGEWIWAEERGRPLRGDHGQIQGWLGSFLDITARKRFEAELVAARTAAEDANRAKSAFLAHMSHELRTPIGVIQGFTDLASESVHPLEVQEYLQTIRRNSHHLGRLVDEILDLSKIEAECLQLMPIRFRVDEVLDDVRQALSAQAREKKLSFLIASTLPPSATVETDLSRLRQILIHVVGNAIKFTSGGEVRVRVDSTPSHLQVTIEDTGIGISPEQQTRLFQCFTQGDGSLNRKFGGAGLGLMISRRLAQALGGDLCLIKSEEGGGSQFLVTVATRLVLPAAVAAVPPQEESCGRRLEARRILVVEDSPDNQALIRRFLEIEGAHVECAEDGEKGLHQARSAAYDLVVMDIQMPVMDGYEAVAKLRGEGFAKPVIALTAHAMNGEKERALSLGFSGFLTKPIHRARLVETLQSHLTVTS